MAAISDYSTKVKSWFLQEKLTVTKMNPEIIRAFTPIFLATIGGAIGIVVLLTPGLGETQRSSGIGLAGTAIAGAAGLAQSTKNESNISTGQNARIVQTQDEPAK